MDYTRLIDDETWAFINRTLSLYPSESATWPVDKNRHFYNDMANAFLPPRPQAVTCRDDYAGAVPIRIYTCREASANVIYFHGGGFILGGLDSHDDACAHICADTGYRVISVDYRLAPEHKHPAQFEDSLAATKRALAQWRLPVVLAGDSAGGNLAAAVSHALRGSADQLAGQVLIYPGLGGDKTVGSYITHAQAPLLTTEEAIAYMNARYGGDPPTDDPSASPLHDTDFSGLPPTVIFTAECDPLKDDGMHYRDRIVAAGGRAHWIDETGLVHGYLRARSSVARAKDSFARITSAISALGAGEWPY